MNMTEFSPSRTRMAGQALKENLTAHEGIIKHHTYFADGSNKLTHVPGMMTYGFAEQRLI
mgnify:CR=1 FL=1